MNIAASHLFNEPSDALLTAAINFSGLLGRPDPEGGVQPVYDYARAVWAHWQEVSKEVLRSREGEGRPEFGGWKAQMWEAAEFATPRATRTVLDAVGEWSDMTGNQKVDPEAVMSRLVVRLLRVQAWAGLFECVRRTELAG